MQKKNATKLDAVYAELLHRIQSGTWKIGEKLPTEPILAKELNCGTSTVSKAMARLISNNLIQRRSRAGTIVIGSDIDVHENENNPILSHLDAYALVYPGDAHESLLEISCGFQDAANSVGRRTLLLGSGPDFKKEADTIRNLSSIGVKGAVLYPIILTPQEQVHYMEAILAARIPIVLLTNWSGINCSVVVPDAIHAGFTATSHLIKLGLKRLGFLSNAASTPSVRKQYYGFRQALELAGIPEDQSRNLLIDSSTPNLDAPLEEPTRIARNYLAQNRDHIDGIVCGADFLSIGILRAAREANIRIPEDIKVVGVSDNKTGSESEVPLTAYKVSLREQGRRAFEILDETVRGIRTVATEELVRGELIIRKSS